MSRRYRIRRPLSARELAPALGLVLAGALVCGAAAAFTGVPALAVVGVAVLAAGMPVVVHHQLRADTVLLLLPGVVTVGRWTLPWPSVSRLVVFDADGHPAMVGAQLRSPGHLPAGVPAAQLDQTTPATPILLSIVDRERLDVAGLAAACRRLRPGMTLVRQTGDRQLPVTARQDA